MYATAIQGTWKKPLFSGLALAALWGCAYLLGPLAPFLALALPLVVCPAFAQGRTWLAMALPFVPMSAYWAGGGELTLGLLILLCPGLCLLVQLLSRRYRLSLHAEAALFAAAFAAGALGMLARVSAMLGGTLFSQLAEAVIAYIKQSVSGGSILYKLVSVGYLTVPDAYANTTALQLGNLIVLAPALQRELLNMLRLRLTEGFASYIPSLLVQGAVLTGLFAAMRAARARSLAHPGEAPPPRFAAFKLTRGEQGAMLILCVITLLTAFSANSFFSLLSSLTYAGFAAVYQLVGAAVLVAVLSARKPGGMALYGGLAAVLYLVFPIGLLMLGLVDQFAHLRDGGPKMPKEE